MQENMAPHRVRAARRGIGLTQKQMARLTGYRSDIQVSRVERGIRPPSVRFLLSSTILFGRSVEDLFKSLYDQIEEHVVREAYLIHERLSGDDSETAVKYRALLTDIISSAAKRHQNQNTYETNHLS